MHSFVVEVHSLRLQIESRWFMKVGCVVSGARCDGVESCRLLGHSKVSTNKVDVAVWERDRDERPTGRRNCYLAIMVIHKRNKSGKQPIQSRWDITLLVNAQLSGTTTNHTAEI